MSYLNIFVGISFGLAIWVLFAVLTDKPIWKAWISYYVKHFSNGRSKLFITTSSDTKRSTDKKANGFTTEFDEHMIAFEQRNRFYQDGKFKMP